MAARRRQGGSRAGTLLVLVGIAGVLGATFVAGVWTGRHWPVLTGKAPAARAAEAGEDRTVSSAARPRSAEPLPALTFYQELTAPLTAPPPALKPARPPRPVGARREPERQPGTPSASETDPVPASAGGGASFTVQVGAYAQRAPAEALRDTLAAGGHAARVTEAETPGGLRYRVHVGVFSTREAARDTATRLGAERALPAFVTVR